MVDKKRCFVIMPISKTANHTKTYWKRHFFSFLKPIIEEDGDFEAFRSEAMR